MKENNNDPIEKIIAKAIEEKYGSSEQQGSPGQSNSEQGSSADRSVYHINSEVYYSREQADSAYRRTEQMIDQPASRPESGKTQYRQTSQQRTVSETSAPQRQRSEQGAEPRRKQKDDRKREKAKGDPKSKKSSAKKKKSKDKRSASKKTARRSTDSRKSSSAKKYREKNDPVRYREKRKVKTKMDVRDDDIYDDDIEEELPGRRRHPIRTLIKLVLVLVIIAFGAYSAVALHYIKMVTTQPEGDRTKQDVTLFESKSVRNILLIGADGRGDDAGRSDSVILLSIDFKSRTITLTSFMRDSYVNIPGHGMNKLNAAYRWGGPELLMDTLELNFRVPIDDYVAVNFESFADIVDAVGGIEITVTTDEAVGMQAPMAEVNKLQGLPKGTDYISQGGTYLMNGNQALAYARLRYVGNADFQRTERQREVMQKIFAKAKKLGIRELNEFASTCAGSVTTNLTAGEMYILSLEMLYFATFDVEELRIPMDDAYSGSMIDGQSVLEIDFDKNIAEIEKRLYS